MPKPIFTALSPNAQFDDVFEALKFVFMPWKWRRGSAEEKLRIEFQKMLHLKDVFFFESGRTCLFALLKALDLRGDDEVLLQAYTCVAVPEPVLWVGAKPVYVDCDEQNLNMSMVDLQKKITKKSKVLIIQHTFGQPAPLDELIEIARENNLFVVEDCAHALGAIYKDKVVGSYGDASFFSFGRDKVISSVFGGALVVKNPLIAEQIQAFHKSCKPAARGWIFQQLIHPPLLAFVKMTYGIYVGQIALRVFKKFGLLSKAVYNEERKGDKPPFLFRQFPNALAALALKQFCKLQYFNQHRQITADFYEKSEFSQQSKDF